MRKILGVLVLIAGILSGLMFFVAGSKLSMASTEITDIRSVGGTSVAEAYYQETGRQGLAYATGLYAFGLGIIALSLGFGGLLLSDTERKTKLEDTANAGGSLSIAD